MFVGVVIVSNVYWVVRSWFSLWLFVCRCNVSVKRQVRFYDMGGVALLACCQFGVLARQSLICRSTALVRGTVVASRSLGSGRET